MAAHVIARNLFPLYAATPIRFPCWLMIFVAFTAITVAILEAMASARKAIYSLLAKDPARPSTRGNIQLQEVS